MSKRFAPIMRDGVDPAQAVFKEPHPGVGHLVESVDGMRFERDIEVPMRDGVRILVDVFLPEGAREKVPAIVGWGPYGKHNKKDHLWPPAGIEPGWISRHTAFEAPDPAYWCQHGYAVVYPDPRGTWYSQGEMNHGGPQEAEDTYDLIEWCAAQPWCNGRVGMSGVSYLAASQYQVAPLKPPHLAAINPWEAFSDWYREFGYHGGMRDTGFVPKATLGFGGRPTRTEDTLANMLAHPLIDDYWQSKDVALDEIECPALFVASWSDQGFHTRGTLGGVQGREEQGQVPHRPRPEEMGALLRPEECRAAAGVLRRVLCAATASSIGRRCASRCASAMASGIGATRRNGRSRGRNITLLLS